MNLLAIAAIGLTIGLLARDAYESRKAVRMWKEVADEYGTLTDLLEIQTNALLRVNRISTRLVDDMSRMVEPEMIETANALVRNANERIAAIISEIKELEAL